MSETIISENDGIATLVNVFEVEKEKQQQLVDILNEGVEKVMKNRPGFISVNILVSKDGTRVINYAQWNSPEDIQATMADPEAQAYAKKAGALATASPSLYSVASVHHA
ncbi:antibiotic biosynthesis monooxygenase [Nocardiopsis terrae]|uniref:Quinol monooxygenase YgiN n=1 Tax=Nocardiopsis terrae TaxID=372655 RepID=A0ABR9HMN6_9ACTN|nr:antibiotic biosynthesis monooxygenase [Nocardiopsis terrae]MBE1460259.1 quinol monooxygenase YgiN [Nocardiopsis terrae]GHC70515.1 antibiotic biosynthesis monooxygenase [Nocardiopsis terrae]